MEYVICFVLVLVLFSMLIPIVKAGMKGILAVTGIVIMALISSAGAVPALWGQETRLILPGSMVTGEIPLVIDSLSAWFILVINFTFITSALYGCRYLIPYHQRTSQLSLHWISYLLTHAGILSVCVIQNSVAFLIAWEIMALGTFILVIFEGNKASTIKAGINYLIQSHVAVLLLTVAFILVASSTGSFSFDAIAAYATQHPGPSLFLMLLFFTGFGFKAGFVPFHTWLPHAHPAAPTHVSGMMSGVLIKIGIYGILRMILLIQVNYLAVGYFILTISVITGVYGVMLAIVQHNLKKLLAYHSIENIGIIGIGIGMGCLGLGYHLPFLSTLGFAGALLHTLNHSLFKSLLFYSAGNIYQLAHTMNIERFGGLMRRMPQTAFLFLLAAMAICGLPPFNGFVSEFILYTGLFKAIPSTSFPGILMLIMAIFGLSLIGGLAILCFTKAFGTIFLGSPRYPMKDIPAERDWLTLLPMYATGLLIVVIGLFPQPFLHMLLLPAGQFTSLVTGDTDPIMDGTFDVISQVGYLSAGFILLSLVVFLVRKRVIGRVPAGIGPTWGCGYVAPSARMQYTASSFVRNYRKLAEPLLSFRKQKTDVKGIFPGEADHHTHARDKTELYLIQWPWQKVRYFLGLFSFLQNGRLQFYILYGMIFIMAVLTAPFIKQVFSFLVSLFMVS